MPEDAQNEAEAPFSLDDIWMIAIRRRWWLAAPIFVVWLAVWGMSWFLPRVYRSETVILVEAQKVPEHYVVSNVASDLQERLQSMTQQVLSRTRLLRIINESNLYPALHKRLTPDEIVEQMRRDTQVELVQGSSHREDVTAFKISYSAASPLVAQHVTGELTRLFIQENLNARRQQSENTTEFLDSALEEARKKLSRQEQRVRDFKSQYLGQLPAQLQPNLQILSGLQAQLQAELNDLNRAKQQNLYLKSLLGQYRSIQAGLRRGGESPELPPAVDQELTRLKTELNELSTRYTEDHPDIIRLKQKIARAEAIKRQLATEIAGAAVLPEESPRVHDVSELRSVSPMLEIESQLKANELEMENRQRQVKHISDEIASYQARLNQIPVREQQMADLTRDYDQSRTNYESLLAKRNQSELATELEKRQQGEQFRMLDPPSFPQKPYKPNRMKLSLMALAVGAFLGAALTGFWEIRDDRLYRELDVTKVVPLAVLASLPPLRTPEEDRRGRARVWMECAVGSAMMILLLAGMLITYRRG